MMGGAISVLLTLAVFIIKLHIKVLLFFLKHFEITNGLIVGALMETFTQSLDVNIWIKVGGIAVIVVGCILLQYFFRPIRIVFSVGSSFISGLIAYGIAEQFDGSVPLVPALVTMVIVATLNMISCLRIGAEWMRESTE